MKLFIQLIVKQISMSFRHDDNTLQEDAFVDMISLIDT